MRIPYYFHKIINNIKNITPKSENKIMLGRWNLKHDQKKLNLFYTQLPDPGYKKVIIQNEIRQ